jgi:hypothetical protein
MKWSARAAGAGGEWTKMHPTAKMKTHALRRIMERLPGVCPGLLLREFDALVDTEPLLSDDVYLIYRLSLRDGRTFVAVLSRWTRHVVTVMTTPCEVHSASRMYRVGDETLERIKNVNRTFRDDQRWRKQQKRTPRF